MIRDFFSQIHVLSRIRRSFTLQDGSVQVIESSTEAKIYFCPKKFDVDATVIRAILNGLVYGSNCTGFNMDRILGGEIRIYFNPTRHSHRHRQYAIGKITSSLSNQKVGFEEEMRPSF